MNIIVAAVFGVVGSFFSVLAKRAGNEYGFCVSVFCSAAIAIYLLPSVKDLFLSFTAYSLPTDAEGGFVCLFKAVGIGYVAQIASDICSDAGQATVASNVRLAGKIAIVMLTLPIIKELFETVSSAL